MSLTACTTIIIQARFCRLFVYTLCNTSPSIRTIKTRSKQLRHQHVSRITERPFQRIHRCRTLRPSKHLPLYRERSRYLLQRYSRSVCLR
ncbi:hypothetical protein BDQ17DRAFT_1376912 [Cyathus striatus]|nr:hypothetical protein BDQ17DRAFT_1376912 [Cyathus striatus]